MNVNGTLCNKGKACLFEEVNDNTGAFILPGQWPS